MAGTIKGGAYKSANGTWHDANGKPLPSSKIKEAEELAAQHAKEVTEAEAVAAGETTVTPVVAKPKSDGRRQSKPKNKDKGEG